MSEVRELPNLRSTGAADEPLHIVCCDENRALCGEDVSGHNWTPNGVLCEQCEIAEAQRGGCGRLSCRLRAWFR